MTIYEEMLKQYGGNINAEHEIMQQIALAGLHQGGFFKNAAFYGGTCLRIFHHLHRFSEDMDFSLTRKNDNIHLENYFQPLVETFKTTGLNVEITKKNKKQFGKIESAFLKENTEAYDIKFQTNKTIKIKIELDTDPPLKFNTEQLLLLQPYSFYTQCFTLPNLFAGKMHALLYRTWKNRVKGRDWYDFEWYVRHQIPLNFIHLQERIKNSHGEIVDIQNFISDLKNKISSTNINWVKDDVVNFIKDKNELNIWSNEYFMQLCDKIVFQNDNITTTK